MFTIDTKEKMFLIKKIKLDMFLFFFCRYDKGFVSLELEVSSISVWKVYVDAKKR